MKVGLTSTILYGRISLDYFKISSAYRQEISFEFDDDIVKI